MIKIGGSKTDDSVIEFPDIENPDSGKYYKKSQKTYESSDLDSYNDFENEVVQEETDDWDEEEEYFEEETDNYNVDASENNSKSKQINTVLSEEEKIMKEAYESDRSRDDVIAAINDKSNNNLSPEDRIKDLEKEVARHKVYLKKSLKMIKNMRIAIIVLTVMLICSLIFIGIIVTREKKDEQAFFGKVDESVHTYKMTEELIDIADSFKSEVFSASTVEISGYEYLVLTANVNGKTVKLCYQNEFPDKEFKDSVAKAYIDCDGTILKISDNYDITKPEKLVAEVVKFVDGTDGLILVSYEDSVPSVLSLYNLATVEKTGSISIESTLQYYFSVECTDDSDKLATITQSGIPYVYQFEDDKYESLKNDGSSAISFKEGLNCKFNEDNIEFVAFPTVGDKAFLGEYKGVITFTNAGFYMDSSEYYAYVPFSYEDYEGDKIVTPREDYLVDRLVISGKNGGRYAFPYYENWKLSSIDYSKVESTDKNFKSYSEDGKVVSKFGVDVSTYQDEVDWKKAKEDGVEFAIFRAAYRGYSKGGIVEDTMLETNVKNATKEKLPVGMYMFTQAITVEEGIEEANFCIEKAKKLGLKNCPIVYDTEAYEDPWDARGNLISREDRTAIARAFCDTVKEAGYTAVIYGNTRWLLLGVDMDQLSDLPVWYAYYGNDPILPYECDIWQYSSSGSVDGVNTEVDMNIMFKDIFKP